jgi:hypothetical protein
MKTGSSGGRAPIIRFLQYMVHVHSFTPLYPLGKIHHLSVKTSLSAPKIGLGAFGELTKSLIFLVFELRSLDRPAHRLVTIPTELPSIVISFCFALTERNIISGEGGVRGVLSASASSPGGPGSSLRTNATFQFHHYFCKATSRLQSGESSAVERMRKHFAGFRRTLHNECQHRRSLD